MLLQIMQKRRLGENICSKVNASNTDHSRSVEEIRKKWSTYMSNTKQKVAKIRREARKTGGGPPPEDISSLEDLVVEIIGDTPIDGIEGGIDTCMELPAREGTSTAVPLAASCSRRSSYSSADEEGTCLLVPYRRKPKGTIVLGSVCPSH